MNSTRIARIASVGCAGIVALVLLHACMPGMPAPEPTSAPKQSHYDVSSLFSEFSLKACDDAVDNDGDGLVDCDDPDCAWIPRCSELPASDPEATIAGLADECAEVTVPALPSTRPADILWVVDSSGSMGDEAAKVRDNINAFSENIAGSGIDHHVVMITDPNYVTVPAPLGDDVGRYRFVDRDVDSHASLERLLSEYFRYQDFLRIAAATQIVVVSDDNSAMRAESFRPRMEGLLGHSFTLHAIVSPGDALFPCMSSSGIAASPGTVYWDLAHDTDGLQMSICASDWTDVFEGLRAAVTISAVLPCAFQIPPPPNGQSLDRDEVNVVYAPDEGERQLVPRVDGAEACVEAGWFYDDEENPSSILLCPASCDAVGSVDYRSSVEVAFGCDSIVR